MIGKLRGVAEQINDDRCIIDVNGVGYLVFISYKTAQIIKQYDQNKVITLFIETIVKEDSIELFGFNTEIEKIWFLELMKVQGIGAKVSQKILSTLSIEELNKALSVSDQKSFSNVSGIGPKLAQRIVTELKESPKKLGMAINFSYENSNEDYSKIIANNVVNDAISALENLGYKKNECLKIINFLYHDNPKITLENLITQCLRELSKKI